MWSTKVCTSRTEVPKLGLKPRSPGEWPWPRASQAKKVEVGQVQFVDQVRHAARVFVAAVEQHDGAAAWPAARASGGRTAAGRRGSAKCDSSATRVRFRRAPRRMRLNTVQAVRAVSTGISQAANGGQRASARPRCATAPAAAARSLLPIGPS
jgi:hypothetical protein